MRPGPASGPAPHAARPRLRPRPARGQAPPPAPPLSLRSLPAGRAPNRVQGKLPGGGAGRGRSHLALPPTLPRPAPRILREAQAPLLAPLQPPQGSPASGCPHTIASFKNRLLTFPDLLALPGSQQPRGCAGEGVRGAGPRAGRGEAGAGPLRGAAAGTRPDAGSAWDSSPAGTRGPQRSAPPPPATALRSDGRRRGPRERGAAGGGEPGGAAGGGGVRGGELGGGAARGGGGGGGGRVPGGAAGAAAAARAGRAARGPAGAGLPPGVPALEGAGGRRPAVAAQVPAGGAGARGRRGRRGARPLAALLLPEQAAPQSAAQPLRGRGLGRLERRGERRGRLEGGGDAWGQRRGIRPRRQREEVLRLLLRVVSQSASH